MSLGHWEQIGWSAEAKLQRRKAFDQEHRRVASRTRPSGISVRSEVGCFFFDGLCSGCWEQLKSQLKKLGTIACTKETKVADTHEAGGEYMQQESS